MSRYREGLPGVPAKMQLLPVDHRGYPVPWFVSWFDGKPDFRVADRSKMLRCRQEHRCWICGNELGKRLVFVMGPMCTITRTTSEPPNHLECAVFAATACPFLTLPKSQYRGIEDLDAKGIKTEGSAGFALDRNPGVCALWTTRDYQPFRAPGGILFTVGEPEEVRWYANGRLASRDEVLESIEGGFPTLQAVAESEGEEAFKQLQLALCEVHDLLPPPGPPPSTLILPPGVSP